MLIGALLGPRFALSLAKAATLPQVEITDPMLTPRSGHTTTVLSDGRVLIIGGRNQSGVLPSAEWYNPTRKSFSPTGLMNEARWDHTATLLSDGRVLITGGRDVVKTLLTAEVFEFRGGNSYFRRVVSPMKEPRYGHTASIMGDGLILITGGDEGGTAEVFDPVSELFTPELLPLGAVRRGHTATRLGFDGVFVTGGGNQSAEYYKAGEHRFSLWPNALVRARTGHAAIVSDQGRMLLLGGDEQGTVEELNSSGGDFRFRLALGKAISSATQLPNGSILILGAELAGVYDPVAGGFEPMGSDSKMERRGQTVTELPEEGKMLVVGGLNKQDELVAEGVVFNPATLQTSSNEYASGSVVPIQGRGFQPGEEIEVEVTRDDERGYEGRNHWLVVTDARGVFATSWQVCSGDCLGASMRVSATALTSRLKSATTFRVSGDPGEVVASPAPESVNSRVVRKVPVTITVTSPIQATPTYLPTTSLPSNQTISLSYSSDSNSGPQPNLAAYVKSGGGTTVASNSKKVSKSTTVRTTTLSLTIPTGTALGSYNILGTLVDGGVAITNTQTAALIVCSAAAIMGQPVSLAVCPGGTATFSVTAAGLSPTYQWRKNGANIVGATTSTLTLSGVSGTDAATYTCRVSSICGNTSVTSAGATLTLNSPPSITSHPATTAVCVGNTVTFSVAATGSGPLTYQWRKDGVDLGGATASTLTISSASSGDAGTYTVVVTGICGAATSNGAVLTVNTPPSISAQPNGATLCPGSAFAVSVTAAGSGLSYQWRKDGVNIGGAISSSYSIASVIAGNAGSYDVIIAGTCGSLPSTAALLTVNALVGITTPPATQTKCVGDSATFSVAATGAGPLTYQWHKAGVGAISGAVASSYTISSLVSGDAGTYTVVVTGPCGSVTSSGAALTVNTPVSLTTQPLSQAKCVGDSVTLSVIASGTGPLTYQWQKAGVTIGGATASMYFIPSAVADDAGAYTVIASGACGPVASSVANLTVNAPPSVLTNPASQAICPGSPVTFSITTTGTGWGYQWYKVGVGAIAGATLSSYTIPSVALGDANTDYYVAVGGACGSVTSALATLTVKTPVSITSHPVSRTDCPGTANVTFSIAASGTAPLTYQWRKNGENLSDGAGISGATTTTLTINPVALSDGASYDAVVSNDCGSATSNAATLTVPVPPNITTQPATQASCTGSSVTLTVAALGTGLTYQWKRDGTIIAGATDTSYSIASAVGGDSGVYSVEVTGACGSVTSSGATLSVAAGTGSGAISGPTQVCSGAQGVAFATTFVPGATYTWTLPTGSVIASGAGTSAITVNFGSTSGTVSIGVGIGSCSTALTITVSDTPTILGQMAGQTVCAGDPVIFSVVGVGQGLTYQWRKNGIALAGTGNLSGVNTSTLSIAPSGPDDAGLYDVTLVSSCGAGITSGAAQLTVNSPPVITTDPVDQAVCAGTQVTFSVAATGSNLTYQWRKDGVALSGFTVDSFVIASPAATDAGSYDCIVGGSCSPTRVTTPATLIVNEPPLITVQPVHLTNCVGSAATFSISATGTGLTYQWRKGAVDIGGANSSSYRIDSVTTNDVASYDVVVTGVCLPPQISNPVALVVNSPPTISSQPSGAVVCVGSGVNFSVTAEGSDLFYQWRKDGADISGATNSMLAIATAAVADGGEYDVLVSGTCTPAVPSSVAILTVNAPPNLTLQPANQTSCLGESVTFAVTATGAGLTYQWRKATVDIPGATSRTLTIPAVALGDAGSYDVVVSGTCAPPQTSNAASLAVNQTPTITSQPVAQGVCVGSAATFTVSATGGSLNYQWRKNGTSIPGATASTLTIAPVSAADAGSYGVVVSNGCLPDTVSSAVALIVDTPITITTPPVGATACFGSSAAFTVVATGDGISYQWRKDTVPLVNGGNIAGATSSTLTVSSVGASDAAAYDVVLSNQCQPGGVIAPSVTLLTFPVRTFQMQPEGQTVCVGANVTLSTQLAGGETGVTYQWKKDGADLADGGKIAGAQTATLAVGGVDESDSATYTVVVEGPCTPGLSDPAVLTVFTPTNISSQPAGLTVCAGQPAVFSVAATGGDLTFQWRKDGGDIVDATSSTYTVASANVNDAGSYSVEVTGACGSPVISDAATLTVNTPPAIATQPEDQAVCTGSPASFTVVATGSNLAYQWRKNGAPISGATSATYTIAAPTGSDAGNYTVVVSGTCSPAVTSRAAALSLGSVVRIVGQPRSQTICAGSPVTFSVQAIGSVIAGGDFTFQWRKNGAAIAGGTKVIYTITSVSAADAGNYDVTISNVCGVVTSAGAILTVPDPAACVVQPEDVTVLEGATATFAVSATGSGLTYQWRRAGKSIAESATIKGTRTARLTVPASLAMAGDFAVVIKGTCGAAATSSVARLTVDGKPKITVQPKSSTTVCQAGPVTLTVTATGTALTYQWRKAGVNLIDGANITGATTGNLTINAVATSDEGAYTVVVNGVVGAPSVTSAVANLKTIKPIGTIGPITGPTSVCAGRAGLTYSVALVSEATKYVWTVPTGARIVSGQGTRSISVTWGTTPGDVSVNATNTCFSGTAQSLAVAIPTLTITQQPSDQTLFTDCNLNVSFSAAAEGTPMPTVQWQFSQNGGRSWANLARATNTTLTFAPTPAQNGYQYRAVLRNFCSASTTTAAILHAPKTATVTTVSVGPNPQQYSDKVTFEATITPGGQCSLVAATNVTFYIGNRNLGRVALVAQGGALRAVLPNATILEKPGTAQIRAIVSGVNPYFTVSHATNTLTVVAENAQASLTGSTAICANSLGKATVPLRATVRDISAVSGDPAFDPDGGTVANARVAFVNRETGAVIGEVPVTASKSDPRIGTAAFNWTVNLGAPTTTTFQVGVIVKNYYDANDAAADQSITVSSVVITQQPTDQTAWENGILDVTFTAAAVAIPPPTVQWQVSANGGRTWSNLSGKTATTLTFRPIPAQNGYRYRAVFKNACKTASAASNPATLIISKIATATSMEVTPARQQYSDRVTVEAIMSPSSIYGLMPATNVTFYVGTRRLGTVPLVDDGGLLKATLTDVAVAESPGTRIVRAVFERVNPYFSISNSTAALDVEAEDAVAAYTGPSTVYADALGRAVVALRATVTDITAVPTNSDFDATAGQIRLARVALIDNSSGALIGEVPVIPGTDPKTGTATLNWTVNIGSESEVSRGVGLTVKRYYAMDDIVDSTIIIRRH